MTRLVCFLALASFAVAQSPTPEADAFFAAAKWTEAEAAYRNAIASNSADGRSWFRLAGSLHWQYRHAESRDALGKAASNGFQVPFAQMLIGREFAEEHVLEHAQEYMEKAATARFAQGTILDTDAAFAPLRTEPWFVAIRSRVELNSKPCIAMPIFRQFDFWLGQWDVESAGAKIAHSSIQSLADGCIILENWMPLAAPPGKSWNVLNQTTGKWEQTWMSAGKLAKLEGEIKDGAMRFTSMPGSAPPGTRTRMSFTPNSDGTIRQLWESSADEGKTWTPLFDGIYRRSK